MLGLSREGICAEVGAIMKLFPRLLIVGPLFRLSAVVFALSTLGMSAHAQTAVTPNGATPAQSTATPATQQMQATSPDTIEDKRSLKIGGGDLLDVKVYGVPELTDSVRVSSRGDVSLPLVGSVHLEGLTSEEGEKLIEQKLKDGGFLRDPHVSIFVREYVTQGISVLGEVTKPGIYPLLGTRRLFDALSYAGGTTPKAGKTVTITHRTDPEHPQIITMSNDPVQSAKSNVEVLPGDTVMVSKAGVVYVAGEVNKPGGFVMDNNESLSVLQAIALAEGLGRSYSYKGVKIIRKLPDGKLQDIPVPLKEMMEGKGNTDLALQNEDILFIPGSAGKNAARRTLEAIVQTATGLAVYRR
jgi:polysaccharide biosynthesis/export protein